MRTTNLAVVISSVLLGAAASAAEPTSGTAGLMAQSTAQTDTSRPATTSPAPDADTATGTSTTQDTSTAQEKVGSGQSNVDKKSSSGSYYPYAAGTSGDDASEPKSTSVSNETREDTSRNTSEKDFGSAEQWTQADANRDGYVSKSELAKAAPELSSSFSAMDVNRDEKLTRQEVTAWHASHKGSMEGDKGTSKDASKPSDDSGHE